MPSPIPPCIRIHLFVFIIHYWDYTTINVIILSFIYVLIELGNHDYFNRLIVLIIILLVFWPPLHSPWNISENYYYYHFLDLSFVIAMTCVYCLCWFLSYVSLFCLYFSYHSILFIYLVFFNLKDKPFCLISMIFLAHTK